MAVVSVHDLNLEQTQANADVREYIVSRRVITNSQSDQAITVRGGLRAIGTLLSVGNDSDPAAYLTGYGRIAPEQGKPSDSGVMTVWMAEEIYSTQSRRKCTDDLDVLPWNEPAVISMTGQRQQVPVISDKDGGDVVNSAGDAFDDLGKDSSNMVLRIQQNQQTVNLSQLRDYTDSVNSTTFFGLDVRQWKMAPPDIRQRYYGECAVYYEVGYEFESNKDTWDLEPIDRGLRTWTGETYLNPNTGQYSVQVMNLDGNGNQLDQNSPLVTAGPFRVYQERDFGLLGIPTNW